VGGLLLQGVTVHFESMRRFGRWRAGRLRRGAAVSLADLQVKLALQGGSGPAGEAAGRPRGRLTLGADQRGADISHSTDAHSFRTAGSRVASRAGREVESASAGRGSQERRLAGQLGRSAGSAAMPRSDRGGAWLD